ncbi:general secretion pathway protein GspB [Massilia aerilata]|uniref:General secretion pathway protein GspB n=1 Tax=Massilia aerilata TaxID=453817 RepID=A0ABW0RY14_9BURK
MSYILEALKKAQAERQLGNAPTIHAPQAAQLEQPGVAASRKPLFIGLGAGALVVLLGGLFMWQRTPAPAAPAVLAAGSTARPAASTATPAAAAPAMPGAAERAPAASATAVNAASNTLEVSAPPAPPPRPAHMAEPPARPAPAPGSRAGGDAPASPVGARSPAASPAVPSAPAAAPRPGAAPSPSPEDSLPYLQQLPDNMQREVPRVAFGGYMYSANPADRLLLVDKTLRHEGEEVAPGLVLEKLLPKAAVMNYRGVRYRVAY